MSAEIVGLGGVALLLGLRHGLDVDHLATIDSLVRAESCRRPRRARWCGLWFSAGHGLSIVAVAMGLALFGRSVELADGLQASGAVIAVSALLTLGTLNLLSAWRAGPQASGVAPGVGSGLTRRLATAATGRFRASAAFGLGALFAVSFDAMSTALLFAAAARSAQSLWAPVGLGGLFTLGMLTVDGITGWCSAWCVRRSHQLSPRAVRITGVLLGAGSLLTAALILFEQGSGTALSPGLRLGASAAVLLLVLLGLACALALARAGGRPMRLFSPRGASHAADPGP